MIIKIYIDSTIISSLKILAEFSAVSVSHGYHKHKHHSKRGSGHHGHGGYGHGGVVVVGHGGHDYGGRGGFGVVAHHGGHGGHGSHSSHGSSGHNHGNSGWHDHPDGQNDDTATEVTVIDLVMMMETTSLTAHFISCTKTSLAIMLTLKTTASSTSSPLILPTLPLPT